MSRALYRTYRPGRLDEVVGQEHVTEPLRRALTADRVHHAYLFSGPRGCGKTSTARILARSLNCERGPTPDPCGECQSCRDLAPNGPGSIDVIELDAASHGGVDDTRDLRERAMFAPAASRYKIYIIDEAHMVSSAGFNALLKLVEEPPEHVRFVFATTEVEKVLPTIRSRTHNYTFRLVPARTLQSHLARVCEAEGIAAEPAALALVARAGAGSVRDSLSVLGQLIAGSGPDGLTYADAVSQLGVTDAALLDATVDALAAEDGAALFRVVDAVVEAGHDPRRFVTDLLERLRDLVVLVAVPGAAESGLIDAPDDQLETMQRQAQDLGLASLSRAADLVSAGLSELRGATAPRLQLELLCARLLLPAVDDHARGLPARLERLERRVAALGTAPAGAGHPAAGTPPAPGPVERDTAAPPAPPAAASPSPAATAARDAVTRPARGRGSDEGAGAPPPPPRLSSIAPSSGGGSEPTGPAEAGADPGSSAETRRPGGPDPASSGTVIADVGPALTQVRQAWPSILEALKSQSRVAWMTFAQAAPLSLSEGLLAVGMPSAGVVTGVRNGGHDERLRQALLDVLALDVRVDVVVDPGAVPPTAAAVPPPTRPGSTDAGGHGGGAGARAGGGAGAAAGADRDPRPVPADAAESDRDAPASSGSHAGNRGASAARAAVPAGGASAARAAVPAGGASAARAAAEAAHAEAVQHAAAEPDLPSPDDPDLDAEGLSAEELAVRALGATRIGEIEH